MPTLLLAALLTACSLFDGKPDDEDDDGGGGADADRDGHESVESGGDDCDDGDAAVHPFADERCNGVDDDCDGSTDEDSAVDAPQWCPDGDGDGYGDEAQTDIACSSPQDGWITTCGDCQDADTRFHPGAPEDDCTDPTDYDCDGETLWADADLDGTPACQDCDDLDPGRHLGAQEVCNGIDDDCDAATDEDDDSLDLSTRSPWYPDADSDGYGAGEDPVLACADPGGRADNALDCDDDAALVNPDMTELCDPLDTDEDCDGLADDLDDSTATGGMAAWFVDDDGDGHGVEGGLAMYACDDPGGDEPGWSPTADDCADEDPEVSPSADEVCDGATDEDCDGLVDDADDDTDPESMTAWYLDGDEDGWGAGVATRSCLDPSRGTTVYAAADGDCDDDAPAISPDAVEVCDAADTDEDCDGLVDDADDSLDPDSASTWHHDADGDGYGSATDTVLACVDPGADWLTDDSDCDDESDQAHPGATEVCDDVDNDCVPSTEGSGVSFRDADGVLSTVTSTFSAGSSTTSVYWTSVEPGTLSFCGGTRYAALRLEHDVTVVGRGGATLDASWDHPVITVEGADVDVEVHDLRLTRGDGSAHDTDASELGGGGVHCTNAGSLRLDGVTVTGNQASIGAGIYLEECPTEVVDSLVEANEDAHYGQGIALMNGALTLRSSVVQDNIYADYYGGGIYVLGNVGTPASLTLIDSELSGNSAFYGGGGILLYQGTVDCQDSAILANEAQLLSTSVSGGGLYVESSDDNRVTSDGCDWGSGDTDNDPDDIFLRLPFRSHEGTDGVFSCTNLSCG